MPPFTDPKQGEREYFARIGEEGRRHAAGKPFSDPKCATYLISISMMLSLLRPPPARIVEFGCGTGWLSLVFAQRGYEVVGIDISPDAIALAEQLRRDRELGNASFRVADYEEVRLDPPVDCVVFHDALHHAESEAIALRAAYDALVPGGMVICMEPGEGHSGTIESQHAMREFGVHEKDMPPQKIIRLARAIGFARHAVLPWPAEHMRHIYRPAYSSARTRGELRGRLWLGILRTVRNLVTRHEPGVVLLWK